MPNFSDIVGGTVGAARGGLRQAERVTRSATGIGIGLTRRVLNRNPQPKQDMDDVTLSRKVETEVFRGASRLKGKVDINAVDGVVWLRGEVKTPAQVKSIEAKVRTVPEVREVENLLHLPKAPAPSRTDTPAAQRKTRTTRKAAEPRRFERTVPNEKKTPGAEPAPTDLAAVRAGRQAAPLGSSRQSDTESSGAATGGTMPRSTDPESKPTTS
jgi:hypothetical protein